MLNPGKIATVGLITGVSGSVVAGGCFYLTRDTRNTIGDLLKSESPAKTLLASTHVGKANSAWTNYKSITGGTATNPWNLNNWTSINAKNEVPQELLDICNTKINEKVKDKQQKEYISFISWCTVTS